MRNNFNKEKTLNDVEEIIDELGLDNCRNV